MKTNERREQLQALAKEISAMSQEQRHEIVANCGAIMTIDQKPLSPFNSCFVIRQRPGATVVGGFQQWMKAGRVVRKGEKGLGIWVPISRKKKEGEEQAGTGFIIGTVFDITQTEEKVDEAKTTNNVLNWSTVEA